MFDSQLIEHSIQDSNGWCTRQHFLQASAISYNTSSIRETFDQVTDLMCGTNFPKFQSILIFHDGNIRLILLPAWMETSTLRRVIARITCHGSEYESISLIRFALSRSGLPRNHSVQVRNTNSQRQQVVLSAYFPCCAHPAECFGTSMTRLRWLPGCRWLQGIVMTYGQ